MTKPGSDPTQPFPELDGVDELSAQVFRAFLGTARLHAQLMVKWLADRGTHPGQALCLRLLTVNDGVTQRDLADTLHVKRPTVTRMLQAMEKAGLIERRPDDSDQRLTHVFLTAEGRRAEKDIAVTAAAYVNATVATLPKNDRRDLVRLLGELQASIGRAGAAREEGPGADAPGPRPRAPRRPPHRKPAP